MKKNKDSQIIRQLKSGRQSDRKTNRHTIRQFKTLEVQQIIQTDKIQINNTNRFDKLTIQKKRNIYIYTYVFYRTVFQSERVLNSFDMVILEVKTSFYT